MPLLRPSAATDAAVSVQLHGSQGQTAMLQLGASEAPPAALGRARQPFRAGQTDSFTLSLPAGLGELQQLQLWLLDEHDKRPGGSGTNGPQAPEPARWHCDHMKVTALASGECWWFVCGRWLGEGLGDGSRGAGGGGAAAVLPASAADQLSRLLKMRLTLHSSDLQGAGCSAQVGSEGT